tara:strand:- start:3204 stop:3692 length:489 start_codon:yes stop_codon:yes gene_type:complete
MEIPTVDSIRNDIKNNSKLFEILEMREKRRESWSRNKKEEYKIFLTRLKKAHDSYIKKLQNEIVTKTKIVLKGDVNSEAFTLIQPQYIECDLEELSPLTIYKGIWNKSKKKYDRLPHIEAGIKNTPIIEINEIMSKYGYKINDITKKGSKTTIKVELSKLKI